MCTKVAQSPIHFFSFSSKENVTVCIDKWTFAIKIDLFKVSQAIHYDTSEVRIVKKLATSVNLS